MKIVVNPRYDKYASFVKHIHQNFDKEGTTIHAGRNIIKVFAVQYMELNVKQYKIPNLFNRLIYTFFRPPKASRAYHYALKLLDKGFNTPEPVGYVELKKGGLLHYSYFISLQCSYTRNMYEFGDGLLDDPRKDIIRSFANYTALLHKAEVYHKDYSPGNILFKEIPGGAEFSLIDINRMEFAPVSIEKGCANFARLWGKEDMFRLIASEYAQQRKADKVQCTNWVLYYRNKFWEKFKRKREIPFEI